MSSRTECPYCGAIHGPKCPLVKAFEYHPDGAVKRVEFYAPNDYGPLYGLDRLKPAEVPYSPTSPRFTTTWAVGDKYVGG
jgi:hypothetical protein